LDPPAAISGTVFPEPVPSTETSARIPHATTENEGPLQHVPAVLEIKLDWTTSGRADVVQFARPPRTPHRPPEEKRNPLLRQVPQPPLKLVGGCLQEQRTEEAEQERDMQSWIQGRHPAGQKQSLLCYASRFVPGPAS